MGLPDSIFRDANRVAIQGLSLTKVEAVTFAAATTGSVAQHDLFTVTGDNLVTIFGICNTSLDSGGVATISVGSVGNVAAIIPVTTATDIDDGDIWVDATPGVQIEALPASSLFVINDGQDITYDILTATITAGQIDFYCLYRPLESTARVVAA